jgi:hypothetical protein
MRKPFSTSAILVFPKFPAWIRTQEITSNRPAGKDTAVWRHYAKTRTSLPRSSLPHSIYPCGKLRAVYAEYVGARTGNTGYTLSTIDAGEADRTRSANNTGQ